MTEVNAVNAQPRELDSISGTELEAIRENRLFIIEGVGVVCGVRRVVAG